MAPARSLQQLWDGELAPEVLQRQRAFAEHFAAEGAPTELLQQEEDDEDG